jgi:t-SNARE complex subunit (syntaxin)
MEKNIQDAHQNVVEAGTSMESANELQKKARKKTMCLVFMVLMLVILVGGLVYFLAF